MITGKAYSANYPEGKMAIRLSEASDGWSLILVITPPVPMFPGLNKEEHIFAGEVMVHEARDVDNLPDISEIQDLRHIIYIKND